MGWCSGTDIFDIVCEAIFDSKNKNTKDIIKKIIIELEIMDWDCQRESDFWNKPIVQEAFKELHPDWFKND
ncbi:MAG: hypothetical protein U9Q27_03355 [Patescibacteria group bacterium]|nr:hypothetical protein [Patescibacteria group bacterium]